jgi:hypothetical protein
MPWRREDRQPGTDTPLEIISCAPALRHHGPIVMLPLPALRGLYRRVVLQHGAYCSGMLSGLSMLLGVSMWVGLLCCFPVLLRCRADVIHMPGQD